VDEADLRWMADQLEIRNLLAQVAQLADTGDLADYGRCWTNTAVWHPPVHSGVPLKGLERTGITDILAGAQERRDDGIQGPGTNTRHVVSTITVRRVGADRATSRTYWRYYTETDTTPRLATMGHYDDELVRTADGWRLTQRRTTRG
jgi:3-phenylpropionate/cinnamic acid dioxygenase small subunit